MSIFDNLKSARTSNKREWSLDFSKYTSIDPLKILKAISEISSLNDLTLHNFPSTSLSEELFSLTELLRLSFITGELTSLPESIINLKLIKFFNVSSHKLNSIPSAIYTFNTLTTLNLSNNSLTQLPVTDVSAFSSTCLLPSLASLDISQNRFTTFPIIILYMSNISELDVSRNEFVQLPAAIHYLLQLKRLSASHNQLEALPYELSKCAKLKTISLEYNSLKDRKLAKLIDQHGATKPKTVLDYLKKNVKESLDSEIPKPDVILKKELASIPKYKAIIVPSSQYIIEISDSAQEYRPHILCCILHNIDLSKDVDLQQFMKIQSDIHAGPLCDNRKLCTIGTHHINNIKFPLKLSLETSGKIILQPLRCDESMTAFNFLKKVESEGESLKHGKVFEHGYLAKYLPLMKSTEYVIYLEDSAGAVLSMAPLTNCVPSQILQTCDKVLVEITSDKSLDICKQAMQKLLEDMLLCGLSSQNTKVDLNQTELSSNTVSNSADKAEEQVIGATSSSSEAFGCLLIEQVRVMSRENTLVSVYPSSTDLDSWDISKMKQIPS